MRVADLQKALRAADPAAVIVSPLILERVIREVSDLPTLAWSVPHLKCFVVDRRLLFRHAEQADLEVDPDQLLPDTVILLARPDADELGGSEQKLVLLKYWRRLFHAQVHLALGDPTPESRFSAEAIRERVEKIGRTEFEEIRAVLVQDSFLPAGADDLHTYIEFASVYLELLFFAKNLLPNFFPGIRDFGQVERLLAADVDGAEMFGKSRLAGAPDPEVREDRRSDEPAEGYWSLIHAAKRAALTGNAVRAAIVRTRAARIAPAAQTASTRVEAEADLRQLTARLGVALNLEENEATEWAKYLNLLLDKADQGTNPVEARLLFDLQNVCEDSERETYTLDVVEWFLSAGKRPIQRPLPSLRLVRVNKHLRSATGRLAAVRLSDADRAHLSRLLHGALKKAEENLRLRFKPVLTTAMEDVGLRPANLPERVAFAKMVEEILDRISAYGFLTFSDLRDTISRNRLKLPDLQDPQDFLRGDALIRLDRRLGSLLDGVYRPSEFYMRWLERFSSFKFGTPLGRAVTRFITVPFGGAWLLVKGTELVLEHAHVQEIPPLAEYLSIVALGFFLMAVFQLAAFQAGFLHGMGLVWHGLRTAFYDFPRRVLPLVAIREFAESWPFQLFYWYAIKPGLLTAILALWQPNIFWGYWQTGLTFIAIAFLVNSRAGRAAAEGTRALAQQAAVLVRSGFLLGLVRFIILLFKRIIDLVEYALHTVNEWLRFRAGDSKVSLVVRTILSVIWFPIGYLARFYMVVLVEPGINPLKFPISSIAAKFMYPVILSINLTPRLIEQATPFIGGLLAKAIIAPTIWLLPDVFGFLFWEIKENWFLYRANRGRVLRPVPVGSHGETIRGFLAPGFHSGTVPRIYTRLRRAERLAYQTGSWHAARSCREQLEEAANALYRFLERELTALLRQSRAWANEPVTVGPVQLATNRVRFELGHANHSARPLAIEIKLREGWLVAGLADRGWLDKVSGADLKAVTATLGYFYKLVGVDLVLEQIHFLLKNQQITFEISADGLVLQFSDGYRRTLNPWARPKDLAKLLTAPPFPKPLAPGEILFSCKELHWSDWVACWQKDQEGEPHPGLAGFGPELLGRTDAIAPEADEDPSNSNGAKILTAPSAAAITSIP
jgi:hypothetical protein